MKQALILLLGLAVGSLGLANSAIAKEKGLGHYPGKPQGKTALDKAQKEIKGEVVESVIEELTGKKTTYSSRDFTPPGLAKKGGTPPGLAKKGWKRGEKKDGLIKKAVKGFFGLFKKD